MSRATRPACSTTTRGSGVTTWSPSLRDPGRASAADVHAAMTHHVAAGPVCRHAVEPDSSDYLETSTLATATLDVEHGRLAVLRGGPCQD